MPSKWWVVGVVVAFLSFVGTMWVTLVTDSVLWFVGCLLSLLAVMLVAYKWLRRLEEQEFRRDVQSRAKNLGTTVEWEDE